MKRMASLLTFTVMLLVLFLLVAPVPSLKAVTEAPKVQWENTYGYIRGISIVEITDERYEGLFMAAQKADDPYGPGGGHGSYNYTNKRNVLIKTDLGGHVHWTKDLPYEVSKMIPAKEGGFTIAGYRTSGSHTGLEIVLEKIDVAGNDEWTMTYAQGDTNVHIRFLTQAQDGGYVLGGSISPQPNTPDKAWILKTDSAGNLQWNNTYGGNSDDPPNRILSVEQTSDGGFICVGNVDGASLVRIDASGNNIQFIKTSKDISLNSVVRTNDGGYFFVGKEQAQDLAYVMETDSNLKVLWDRTYSERYNFRALKDSSGDGYLLYSNGYLMKIDSSGDVEWSKSYGDITSLIQTEDTGFAFTGSAPTKGRATTYIWAGKTAPEPISQQTETPPPEPFFITWIVIAVVIVAVIGLGLFVYFKKRKH